MRHSIGGPGPNYFIDAGPRRGTDMDADTLQSELDDAGELMVKVEEFDQPFELHLHDTTIKDETITVQLDDGRLTFGTDRVAGYWRHLHSTADYGLE